MRILIINEVLGWSSTGKIAGDLAKEYEAKGWEAKVAYGRSGYVPEEYRKFGIRIGNDLDVKINALKARVFDNEGLNAKGATKIFLQWAEEYNPDLLWLHNLHGYYINYEMLFAWIKFRPQMEVKWTLHDCWAFTGHCTHFSFIKCYRWKSQKGCFKCPQIKQYPKSFFRDNSKKNFEIKQKSFSGVPRLTIVVVSHWLENLVKQSFLRDYPTEVVYNKVDSHVFKPTPSEFRQTHMVGDNRIILGVANVWNERKGLYDYYKLADILGSQYQVVLLGLNRKQIQRVPSNIMGLPRTTSKYELAKIYSAADVYFSASKEETFGMTLLEALSCGTPAICYADTASEEICSSFGGHVCPQGDISNVARLIKKLT